MLYHVILLPYLVKLGSRLENVKFATLYEIGETPFCFYYFREILFFLMIFVTILDF